ncbi:ribonuclease Z [soil metagenome]
MFLVPLGTASAIPTRRRHLSATVLWREGEALLFDCGEGTQFRLLAAGIRRSQIRAIFVTHFHGDHLYGLMGLLTTMVLMGRTKPLRIVSPPGLGAFMRMLPGLASDRMPFVIDYVEVEEGGRERVVFDRPAYQVYARPIEHRLFAIGFRFEEKTRPGNVDGEKARALGFTEGVQFEAVKRGEAITLADGRVVRPSEVVGPQRPGAVFAYVLDTVPCQAGVALSRDADLVMHEGTFADEHEERAVATGHSTARGAAQVARDARARHLLLTHFSARYDDVDVLLKEAREVFPNTEAAEELKRYPLAAGGPATGVT